MNEHDLSAGLRTIHRERAVLPGAPSIHQRVRGIQFDDIPQQRRWLPLLPRFQSMFSATKFVVAGVIVALFGGFLLAGVLTQPSEEQAPALGAPASATTQAEPTEVPTSEPAATTSGPGTFSPAGSLSETRVHHRATLLPDGRVAVFGGLTVHGQGEEEWQTTVEIWDPGTTAFSSAGTLMGERPASSAGLLPDGRILVVGVDGTEVWDPATETSVSGDAISSGSTTILPDGRVLIIADAESGASPTWAEIWDPETGTTAPAGILLEARNYGHTATLLPDGRVLIVGGWNSQRNVRVASAEIWDPETLSFSPAGTLKQGRGVRYDTTWHTATALRDGRVLVVGGTTGSADPRSDLQGDTVFSAEVWDPETLSFSPAGTLAEGRFGHTASLLPDGRVLVIGGAAGDQELPSIERSEIWNPTTASFSPGPSLQEGRIGHRATVLPDGRVLVIGGSGYHWDDFLASAELWEPEGWQPEAEAVAEADSTSNSPDILPGVDLVTERVEPGVYRVLSDGVRDLIEPRAMAIGQDGHVWLTWEGQRHDADRQDPGVLRRLGEPGEQAHEAANWGSDMAVDRAGTFWGTHDPGLGEDLSVTSFDGATWTIHDWPAAFEPEGFSVEAAPDGSVLVTSRDGVARIRDGEWTLLPSWEAVTRGEVHYSGPVATDDTVWLGCGRHIRTLEAGCEGLLRFDGTAWDVMTPVPGRSDLYAWHLAAGSDGTLWAYLHDADDEEDRYLARLRDDRWSVFSAEDGVPLLESTYEWGTDLSVDADGTLWMATSMDWDDPRASATGLLELPHGVASFDGSTWRQYLADVDVQQVEAIDGHVWALDSEDYQGMGVYGSGLYVITPEAVAAAE